MARSRSGAATARAVVASVLVVGVVAVVVTLQARRRLVEGERQPLPAVPPQPVMEAIPEPRAAAPVETADPDPPDPVRSAWLKGGAAAAADMDDLSLRVGDDPATLGMARLQVEALLTQGRVEDAVMRCERLRQAVAAASSLQSMEPDVLEQDARARIMAGEVEMRRLERDLKASIEARQLMGTPVSVDAWPRSTRCTRRWVTVARRSWRTSTPYGAWMRRRGSGFSSRNRGGCRRWRWWPWTGRIAWTCWIEARRPKMPPSAWPRILRWRSARSIR